VRPSSGSHDGTEQQTIAESAEVIQASVAASNDVIHVIDAVLIARAEQPSEPEKRKTARGPG
jgi:hypothetical protein